MEMTGSNIPLTPETILPEVIKPEIDNPLEKPDGRNKLELVKYYILFPIYAVSIYTIPGKNCLIQLRVF
jgi:hypothetical protein